MQEVLVAILVVRSAAALPSETSAGRRRSGDWHSSTGHDCFHPDRRPLFPCDRNHHRQRNGLLPSHDQVGGAIKPSGHYYPPQQATRPLTTAAADGTGLDVDPARHAMIGLAMMPVAMIIALFLENFSPNWLPNWAIAVGHSRPRRHRRRAFLMAR